MPRTAKPDIPLTDEQRELVEENLALAIWYAGVSPLTARFADRNDVIQAASIGLCHAASIFDVARGVKFVTHAVWWMRCYVQNAAFDQSGIPIRRYDRRQELGPCLPLTLLQPTDMEEIPADTDHDDEATPSGQLKHAFQKLTPQERAAVKWVLRGVPLSELSRRMGLAKSSAWRLLSSATRRIIGETRPTIMRRRPAAKARAPGSTASARR